MTWEKGQSGNPAGARPGRRHTVTQALVNDILTAYQDMGGVEYLKGLSKREFAHLMSRILPKESTIHADVLHAWEAAVGRSQEAVIRKDERVKSEN